MIWPFTHRTQRIAAEQAEVEARIAIADEKLRVVQRRWPTVESMRDVLVTRREENGFGEELTVSWTPRGRVDAERSAVQPG